IMKINLEIYLYENIFTILGKKLTKDVYTIDYEKLSLDSSPYVKSPYSDNNLPLIMDTKGKLYVDYRIDLNEALKEYDHNYEMGDDIRFILAENTPFLIVYSFYYKVKDNEPIFMEK